MALNRRRLFVAAAILVAGTIVSAQDKGEVFGLVKDPSGRVLPGVNVTLGGPALPQPRTIATDTSGAYRFTDVPAGTYTAVFRLSGFFPFTRESLVVASGARVGLNISLALGPPDLSVLGPEARLFKSGEVPVQIETPMGKILIAVDAAHAPVTSANFLKYVDAAFYNGGRFYRVTRPDNYTPNPPNRPMMEIIQAGINPARAGEQFPPIPLERTSVTGLKHVVGTVSMARGTAADTARSDFFILLDDQPSLDFGGKRFDDGQGAAAFARVISGIDVMKKIQQQPATGDKLNTPVTIVTAARVK